MSIPPKTLEEMYRRVVREEVTKVQATYLELAQTMIIEQSVLIPIDPGTYDVYFAPDVKKLWYLGYVELTTSANTSGEVYMKSIDGGGEALIFSVGKGATNFKDFKIDYGANCRCVQLRLRFKNDGTTTENQTLVFRGVEVSKPA